MRAIWKGYLKCALVMIPVKLYNAVRDHSIQFSLLHKECGSRIKQLRYCPTCDKIVSGEELVRGYQYGKDRWITVSDEEIERAKRESTDVIEVVKFVKAEEIPPVFLGDSHYLVPDGDVAAEAFTVLAEGMKKKGVMAIAKGVMRTKERLFSLRPYDGALMAFDLHWADEVVPLATLEEVSRSRGVKVDPSVLEMMGTLIENLSGSFVPEEFKDEYTETLIQIIRAKAEGQQWEVRPQEETKKVVDFMEALRQSLAVTAAEVPKRGVVPAGRAKAPRRKAKKE